jgi:nucleoside-diphosphate-sugar epimerase
VHVSSRIDEVALPPVFARHIRPDVGVRIIADALMIGISLFLGLMSFFIMEPLPHAGLRADKIDLSAAAFDSLTLLLRGAPVLIPTTIGLFVVTGVYIRTRFYRAGSKVPRLIQSITLGYLIFGFFTYSDPAALPIPAAALVGAWTVTLLMVVGGRFWSYGWKSVRATEHPTPAAETRPTGLRHVLVIGGAGYIGSVLCRQLLARGYSVRVLDALLYGDEAIQALTDNPEFELIEGDSRDVSHLVSAVRGMDAVVHLGEIVGDPACALDEQVTLEINLAATRMAADVAKGFGVQRFVYASSCSVYGASEGIVDERSELHPVSLYAHTKMGAEHVLQGMRCKNFHPVIVRFATVYGVSPRPRFDLVVNALAAQAYVDGAFTVFGGSQWRPFVHVSDVARALILCLEKPVELVDGQIFNVGSDSQNYTISQIGECIKAILPQTAVETLPTSDDNRNYHVSFAKIRAELGFDPQMTVSDGIREIVEAVRAGLIPTYGDPRHNNAQFLRTDYGRHRVHAIHPSPLYLPDGRALEYMFRDETRIVLAAADESEEALSLNTPVGV